MPKGKKIGGKDWKPGESGNPKGRPPIPPELKAFRERNLERFEEAFERVSKMTAKEIQHALLEGTLRGIDAMVAANMAKAATGSVAHYNAIEERVFGAKPKVVQVAGEGGGPIQQELRVTVRRLDK